MDTRAHAFELLARNRFLVLATADADGNPWATPVWFAPDGLDRIFWLSWPGSRHSRLIASRPEVALTVFDSSRPSDEAAALYAVGVAGECIGSWVDVALGLVNQRCQEHGLPSFTRERVTDPARLRLYMAEVTRAWVLDQDSPVDERAPVPLDRSATQ